MNTQCHRIFGSSFFAIAFIILLGSCSENQSLVREGTWRGEFLISQQSAPVTFNVTKDSLQELTITFINGKERAAYSGIRSEKDSVIIPLDIYDSYLIVNSEGNSLKGFYRKNGSSVKGIPFEAKHGESHRFVSASNISATDLSGTWDVEIQNNNDTTINHTVGLFEQSGNELTGTIMTTTGDYRYFAGKIDGTGLELSAFSGSAPRLIKGKLLDEDNFEAELIGFSGRSKLKGKRNTQAALPDAYKLTYLKDTTRRFTFTFPDLEGRSVSLTDEKYKGKVVIVTILGSWCPNCIDENAFLAPWYKANRNRGIEIIGLAFERKDDLAFAKGKLDTFKKKFDVEYDILFAGKADKKEASEKLNQLNAVLSFPTTIFIDRAGKVRKIHTGFTGPATGRYYDEYVLEFNREVDNLVNEPNPI